MRPGLPEPGPTGCQDPGGPARRPARAPDGGQVVHARGLGLTPERAQLAAAAGDVDLRAPAVPVGAHAAVLRALGGRARAQLRRQRRVRRLACARGGPASRPRQPWRPCWNIGTKPFGVRLSAHCTHPTPAAIRVIAWTCPYAMLSPGLAQHARHRQLADRLLVCARLLARTLSCTSVPQNKMTQRLLSACLSHTRNRQEAALVTQEREARGLHTLLRRGVDAARRPLLQRVRHHLRATPRPLLSAAGALPAPLSVASVQKGRARLPPMHWVCPWHRYGSAPSSALHSKRRLSTNPPGSRVTSHAPRVAAIAACSQPIAASLVRLTPNPNPAHGYPGAPSRERRARLAGAACGDARAAAALALCGHVQDQPRLAAQVADELQLVEVGACTAPRARTPLATRAAAVQRGGRGGCRRPARCRQWRLEQPPSERAALSVDGHGRCSDSPSATSTHNGEDGPSDWKRSRFACAGARTARPRRAWRGGRSSARPRPRRRSWRSPCACRGS